MNHRENPEGLTLGEPLPVNVAGETATASRLEKSGDLGDDLKLEFESKVQALE